MFIVSMVVIFMVASCVHPREFANIIFGLIFFLMIPSTYVFLTLYSLINLNVINWGTREAVMKATGKSAQKDNILNRLLKKIGVYDENSVMSRLFSCCIKLVEQSEVIKSLERRFEQIEREVAILKRRFEQIEREVAILKGQTSSLDQVDFEGGEQAPLQIDRLDSTIQGDKTSELYQIRSRWMDAEYLQGCDRGMLKPAEDEFWSDLIEKYLKV
jgi:chitin synthase